jgi:hypothetical protein
MPLTSVYLSLAESAAVPVTFAVNLIPRTFSVGRVAPVDEFFSVARQELSASSSSHRRTMEADRPRESSGRTRSPVTALARGSH